MNPNLNLLQPYPFQKLRNLFAGATPSPSLKPISLSIGEPKHPTPDFIREALVAGLDGLANYPTTMGNAALRQSIAQWLSRRFGIPLPDAEKQILPVNGSREALFAFAQAVINTQASGKPVVIAPNPFYQIYEGAALLAGAEPFYLNCLPGNGFKMDWHQVSAEVWRRTQLVYTCSPGNPTGAVMDIDDWKALFALSDEHGFVIAADECYSEIYFEDKGAPLGALTAAHQLGRGDYRRLVSFNSLSKRSNVPGMRSGFVAGDAAVLEKFLHYRTYHGCAMNPAVQAASTAAWNDEPHVAENRRQYTAKFAAVAPILGEALPVTLPDASFYLWLKTPVADTQFARGLYEAYNVTVLPGSFLAREARGVNPGAGYVRIALVAGMEECVEAARRIVDYTKTI